MKKLTKIERFLKLLFGQNKDFTKVAEAAKYYFYGTFFNLFINRTYMLFFTLLINTIHFVLDFFFYVYEEILFTWEPYVDRFINIRKRIQQYRIKKYKKLDPKLKEQYLRKFQKPAWAKVRDLGEYIFYTEDIFEVLSNVIHPIVIYCWYIKRASLQGLLLIQEPFYLLKNLSFEKKKTFVSIFHIIKYIIKDTYLQLKLLVLLFPLTKNSQLLLKIYNFKYIVVYTGYSLRNFEMLFFLSFCFILYGSIQTNYYILCFATTLMQSNSAIFILKTN